MSALLRSFAASLQEEEEQALTTQSELAFTPRPSLWEHVSSLLQPAERNEAKLVIGSAIILDNQQLHSEVHSLIDIVTCLQATTHAAHAHTSSTQPSSIISGPFSLAHGVPPLRLRGFEADRTAHLKDEIAQLIAAVRDKARQRGESDTARIWSPRSERDKSIVAMVGKESASSTSRSISRSSRCSTARPSTASTARSSSASTSASRPASSSMSSLTSSVASLSSLSIFTLDSAVTRIQAALQEERDELLRDIDYLRSAIDEEEEEQADERRKEEEQESVVAPSEMELRALNKQLKAAVAEEEQAARTLRLLTAVPSKATFKPAKQPLTSLGREAQQQLQQAEKVQSEESVQAILSSLDDLEASFFHHSDQPQPAAATAPTTAASSTSRPVAPLSSPPPASSHRPPNSVFTIRSSLSSSSPPSSAASSPRAARLSSLSNVRASEAVRKPAVPRLASLQQIAA